MDIDLLNFSNKQKSISYTTKSYRFCKSDLIGHAELLESLLTCDSFKKNINKEDLTVLDSILKFFKAYQNSEDSFSKLKAIKSLILFFVNAFSYGKDVSLKILDSLSSKCTEIVNISESCAFEYVHNSLFQFISLYSKYLQPQKETKDNKQFVSDCFLNDVFPDLLDLFLCLRSSVDTSAKQESKQYVM